MRPLFNTWIICLICRLDIMQISLLLFMYALYFQAYLEQAQQLVINENILLQTLGSCIHKLLYTALSLVSCSNVQCFVDLANFFWWKLSWLCFKVVLWDWLYFYFLKKLNKSLRNVFFFHQFENTCWYSPIKNIAKKRWCPIFAVFPSKSNYRTQHNL